EPLRDAAGQICGTVGITLDITDRHKAEDAAQQNRKRLEDLVNSIDGIVWEADPRTFEFTFVSRRAERVLGYPISNWLGDPKFWPGDLPPADRDDAVAYCVRATAELRDHDFEYRMIAADGRIVWLHDLVTVVAENGQAVKLWGVMVDITHRKHAEEELRASK